VFWYFKDSTAAHAKRNQALSDGVACNNNATVYTFNVCPVDPNSFASWVAFRPANGAPPSCQPVGNPCGPKP
jgi:hypothetical protein